MCICQSRYMNDKNNTINELRTIVKQQAREISELKKQFGTITELHAKEIAEMRELHANEISELKKQLIKYINPNTPSSSNKHIKPNTQGLKSKGAKKGAPVGHKGTTRMQIIDRTEEIDTDVCPNCKSHNLKDKQVFKRIIENIPEPIVPEVVESNVHKKKCLDCGHVFIPKYNTTPLKGKFGLNIMILVIFLKFILRGVLRKTAFFLDDGIALKLTPASVNAIVKRVADAAETEYNDLKERIRTAKIVYADETSFSVLGKNQWVWVFRTSDDILLVIRPSRGNKIVKEILGEEFNGTVVCDCWRAYDFLQPNANLQRCWAHLLRKSGDLNKSATGRHFHEKLKKLFKQIKEFNTSNPTGEQRIEKYAVMTKELKKIVSYYRKYEPVLPVAKYVNNNLGNWFTCVKIKGVEPTNNFAEQAIRETVVVRKIIGAFRSETGKENYEALASLIASWQLKKLNLKVELKNMLVKNLCFCC